MNVIVKHAAIDVFKSHTGEERIIVRGVLDALTMAGIKTGSYQREILSNAKIGNLVRAIETSTVPDIELGMRGDKHRVQSGKDGDTFTLICDVYVIDGLQRITAAMRLMQEKPTIMPRIGVTVHFDTTEEWERERFRILNSERTRLSVNVLLRNARVTNEAVDMLYKLCTIDQAFVLYNRVQWQQHMLRTEILAALQLCKVVGVLHSRFGSGRSSNYAELVTAIEKTMKTVGRTTMRENIKTFFDLLEECYGVRRIVFSHGAVQIKSTFMLALADVITRHKNFWRGQRLFVDRDLRFKISKFPLTDPAVSQLASSSGKAGDILYNLLVDHINSGKRTRRLEPYEAERGVEAPKPVQKGNEKAEELVTSQ